MCVCVRVGEDLVVICVKGCVSMHCVYACVGGLTGNVLVYILVSQLLLA